MTAPPSSRPIIILTVEWEGVVRMEIADVLTEAGYRVIAETKADHALAVLGVRSDIRLLFTELDLSAPLDGYALARIVDQRWRDIAILVTSSTKHPKPDELPTRARFIRKPYAAADLLLMVRALLGEGSEQIIVEQPKAQPGMRFVPEGLRIDHPHTSIGPTGGLAQPLPDPDE